MNKEEIKMKEYSEEEKEKMNHTMYNLEYCLEGWKKINNSINNIDMECIKEILYKQSWLDQWLDHMECQLYYYKDELDKALEEKVELKKWLKEQKQFIEDIPTFSNDIKNNHIGMVGAYQNTLDKIKELEEGVK